VRTACILSIPQCAGQAPHSIPDSLLVQVVLDHSEDQEEQKQTPNLDSL
jgi:hypothetical protein